MKQCPMCSKEFESKNKFCSVQCRNTNNARIKKPNRPKSIADNPKEGKKTWRMCPTCKNVGNRQFNLCIKHMSKKRVWSDELDKQLKLMYPIYGTQETADKLGLQYKQVLNRAGILGLIQNDDTRRRNSYDKNRERMKLNNPMFNPTTVAKAAKTNRENGNYERTLKALFEGHARIRNDKPTKLELKLYSILESFNVSFEPQYIIKVKFVVDCKIDNLIIQADGDYWHGHKRFEPLTDRQIAQQKRDKAQDKYLTTCGYTVVRIWESDMTAELVKSILIKHGIMAG